MPVKQWWCPEWENWTLRSLFLKGFGGCPFWDFSNLTHHLSHMIPLKDDNIAAQPNLGQHQVLSLLLPCCAKLSLNINSSLCLTSQMFICCLLYSFYLLTGIFFFFFWYVLLSHIWSQCCILILQACSDSLQGYGMFQTALLGICVVVEWVFFHKSVLMLPADLIQLLVRGFL